MENPKTLSEALCHIYKLRGANDLKDPAMLTAVFPDIAPKLKAERFLIETLAKSGCLKKLAAADGLPTGEAASIIASAVAVLSQQYSIDPEKADVLCHTYLNALRGKAYIPKSSGANGGKSGGANGGKSGGANGGKSGGANGGKSGGANGGKSGGANGGKQTDPPPAAQQQGCGKGPVFILLLLAVFGILCGVFTGAGIPDPGYFAFLITGAFAIIIAVPLFSKKKK